MLSSFKSTYCAPIIVRPSPLYSGTQTEVIYIQWIQMIKIPVQTGPEARPVPVYRRPVPGLRRIQCLEPIGRKFAFDGFKMRSTHRSKRYFDNITFSAYLLEQLFWFQKLMVNFRLTSLQQALTKLVRVAGGHWCHYIPFFTDLAFSISLSEIGESANTFSLSSQCSRKKD